MTHQFNFIIVRVVVEKFFIAFSFIFMIPLAAGPDVPYMPPRRNMTQASAANNTNTNAANPAPAPAAQNNNSGSGSSNPPASQGGK